MLIAWVAGPDPGLRRGVVEPDPAPGGEGMVVWHEEILPFLQQFVLLEPAVIRRRSVRGRNDDRDVGLLTRRGCYLTYFGLTALNPWPAI